MQKEYNLSFYYKQMLSNIQRLEVWLWILISAYWATWIWNLMACMPNPHKDICEIFKTNNFSYSFWLISSFLLLLFWILYFDNIILVILCTIELIITICLYIIIVPNKHNQIKKYQKDEKKFKENCKNLHKY